MDIPQDWKYGTLENLCSLKQDSCMPCDSGLNVYVGLEHIESGRFFVKSFGKPDQVVSSKNRFAINDVLYGKLRPYLDKATIMEVDGICSTDIIVLTPKNRIPPIFVVGLLHTDEFIQYAKQTTNGVNHPRTSWASLREFPIQIPPLSDQQKIAAVLFKIQQAIEIQESIIEKMRELKKSTLHHVFTHGLRGEKLKETEIGPIPNSWLIRKIGAIGKIVTGTTPPTKHKEYYEGGHNQFIAPNDIGKTTRIYSTEKKITDKGLEVSRILPNESICFVCIGSTIGKVGITVEEKATTNQQINAVIVNDDYDPYFVTYLMDYKSEYIASFTSPSPVPILSKGKFEEIKIMLSSDMEEQQEIARVLMTIDQKIDLHTAKKSTLQDLFKTLLNKLMTGEIRVNDLDIDVSEVSA